MPGPRLARNRPTGVSSPSAASELDAARRRPASTPPRRPAPRRARDARAGRRSRRSYVAHRLVEVLDGDADVMDPERLHPADVTVAPVVRRLLPALVVLVARVARPAAAAARSRTARRRRRPTRSSADAKAAATSAKAVHVSGAITDAGQPLTLDITIVKGAGGQGTMSESGLKFEIIRVGNKAYIKGSAAFLRKFAGAAGAQLLRGKWLQGSATTGDLAALAPLTDITKLFNGALGSHGKLENARRDDLQGAEGRRDQGHDRRAGRSTSPRPARRTRSRSSAARTRARSRSTTGTTRCRSPRRRARST